MAATSIIITSPLPTSVEVNQPLNFTVVTMTVDPLSPGTFIPLVTGRHSILIVDLTIAWDTKNFNVIYSGNYNFYRLQLTQHTLNGSEVDINGQFDRRIRKQCSNGTASFNDVRIVDSAENIQLNFTQTLPYFPWERVPPVYNDSIYYIIESMTLKTYAANSISPAIVFTPPFNVTCELPYCGTSLHTWTCSAVPRFCIGEVAT